MSIGIVSPEARTRVESSAATYQYEVHAAADTFTRLRPTWEGLSAADAGSTVFQTWTWCRLTWELTPPPAPALRVVLFRSASGEPVGLAPLWLERMGRARVLRWIGHRRSDYHDLLIAPHAEAEAVVAALRRFLQQHADEWDLIDFVELGARSRLMQYLPSVLPEAGSLKLERASPGFQLALPATYETYLQSLSGHMRRDYRRKHRRMLDDHWVTIDVEDGTVHPQKTIAGFIDLHQKRMAKKREPGLFRSAERRERYEAFYTGLTEAGLMRWVVLKLNGNIRAVIPNLLHQGMVTYLNAGHDPSPAFSRYSLGQQALLAAIEMAFEEGATVFDFGRGDQEYKGRLAPPRPDSLRLLVLRRPLRAAPPLWAEQARMWASRRQTLKHAYSALRNGGSKQHNGTRP